MARINAAGRPTNGVIDIKKEAMIFKLKRANHDIFAVACNLKATTITDELVIQEIHEIQLLVNGLNQQIRNKGTL